jgi:hypothetical protein
MARSTLLRERVEAIVQMGKSYTSPGEIIQELQTALDDDTEDQARSGDVHGG